MKKKTNPAARKADEVNHDLAQLRVTLAAMVAERDAALLRAETYRAALDAILAMRKSAETDSKGEEAPTPPFQPGDRVSFKDTSKPCHRPGLHYVERVEPCRLSGQRVYLVGLRNDRRRHLKGQYYPDDLVLVKPMSQSRRD